MATLVKSDFDSLILLMIFYFIIFTSKKSIANMSLSEIFFSEYAKIRETSKHCYVPEKATYDEIITVSNK
jgi:hypothetical protein